MKWLQFEIRINSFSWIHLIILGGLLVIILGIVWSGFNAKHLTQEKIMNLIIAILVGLQILRIASLFLNPNFNINQHLPLYLEDILVYVIVIWWITKNKTFENFLFYMSLIAGILKVWYLLGIYKMLDISIILNLIIMGFIVGIVIYNSRFLNFKPRRQYFMSSLFVFLSILGLQYFVDFKLRSHYNFFGQIMNLKPFSLILTQYHFAYRWLALLVMFIFVWFILVCVIESRIKQDAIYTVSQEYIDRKQRTIR